jgi:hypothetical protein
VRMERLSRFLSSCARDIARVHGETANRLTAGTLVALRALLHALLKRALKEALALGLVARNVADAVTPPRAVRPHPKAWDADGLRRSIAVAAASRCPPTATCCRRCNSRPPPPSPRPWLRAHHPAGDRRVAFYSVRRQKTAVAGGLLRVEWGEGAGTRTLNLVIKSYMPWPVCPSKLIFKV